MSNAAMRYISVACTFVLFAVAISLFSYVGLIFMGFSGVSIPLLSSLNRIGFFVVPMAMGLIAGAVAALICWKSIRIPHA